MRRHSQRLRVRRPARARLGIELDPPIICILSSAISVTRTLRQPPQRLRVTGKAARKCAFEFAVRIGEQNVGNGEIGTQNTA